MLHYKKFFILSIVTSLTMLFVSCSGGGGGKSSDSNITNEPDTEIPDNNDTTDIVDEEETTNVRNYYPGDSVTIKKNDRYRAVVEGTEVTLLTNPETEETQITVHLGEIEVTFN